MQIQKIDGMDVRAKLIILIPQIAKMYGGRTEIDKIVLGEAIRVILKKFGTIGLDEIKEAYRSYYAGELGELRGAEMYGGEFNVGAMSKILAAYKFRRSKILASYILGVAREKDKINDEALRIEKREEFEKSFPAEVMKKREEIKEWKEVPIYWFSSLYKRGWIKLTESEIETIGDLATSLAMKRVENFEREMSLRQFSDRCKMIKPNFKGLRKNIAGQIAVFKKVVQNKDFKIVKDAKEE